MRLPPTIASGLIVLSACAHAELSLCYIIFRPNSPFFRRSSDIAADDVLKMSHDSITERKQRSSDPAGRSALQGLGRLMRHVALWERACQGDIE